MNWIKFRQRKRALTGYAALSCRVSCGFAASATHALTKVTPNVVPGCAHTKRDEKNILEETKNRLGNEIKVKINFSKEAPELPNAEFTFIISKMGKPPT